MKADHKVEPPNAAKSSQNAKNGGSKPEKVKVYRNGCEGCVHANQGVCCGGVR